jgi:transposase
MLKPAVTAPASGPTITARRADVARLTRKGLKQREIALELGCGATTVARDQRALGIDRGPPGKPVKYPPVEIGSCGTPGCVDPDCAIPCGECHCGCGAETAIATRHDRRRGYIKGKPERFLRAHYDRSTEEYRQSHADKMTATMNELYADPRRKAEWVRARHTYPGLPPNTRYYGYLGAGAGIEAGRAKGGRKPKATPEQQQQMLCLDRDGLSLRAIAEKVFGDRDLYKRVERFLAR